MSGYVMNPSKEVQHDGEVVERQRRIRNIIKQQPRSASYEPDLRSALSTLAESEAGREAMAAELIWMRAYIEQILPGGLEQYEDWAQWEFWRGPYQSQEHDFKQVERED